MGGGAGAVGAGGRKTHQRVGVTRWWVVVVAKGEKPTNESFRLVGGRWEVSLDLEAAL